MPQLPQGSWSPFLGALVLCNWTGVGVSVELEGLIPPSLYILKSECSGSFLSPAKDLTGDPETWPPKRPSPCDPA